MKILISNDDGVHAHGLRALVRAVRDLGEVLVVVPDRPRSACGHSVTLHKPLRVEEVGLDGEGSALICNGTPADCVALAICELLPEPPDLVIAGINLGPNLGDDVSYSGTIAAAMEGAIFDVKAMAFSVCGAQEVDFSFAAALARELAPRVVDSPLSPGTFLNVNVPHLTPERITGIELTRQGRRRWVEQFQKREDMRGGAYYWRGGRPEDDPKTPGTDVWAVHQGRVSVTPLHLVWSSGDDLDLVAELVATLSGRSPVQGT